MNAYPHAACTACACACGGAQPATQAPQCATHCPGPPGRGVGASGHGDVLALVQPQHERAQAEARGLQHGDHRHKHLAAVPGQRLGAARRVARAHDRVADQAAERDAHGARADLHALRQRQRLAAGQRVQLQQPDNVRARDACAGGRAGRASGRSERALVAWPACPREVALGDTRHVSCLRTRVTMVTKSFT